MKKTCSNFKFKFSLIVRVTPIDKIITILSNKSEILSIFNNEHISKNNKEFFPFIDIHEMSCTSNMIHWEIEGNFDIRLKLDIEILQLESEDHKLNISFSKLLPYSPENIIDDWIVFFYSLKFILENEKEMLNLVNYNFKLDELKKEITLQFPIKSKKKQIYNALIKKEHIRKYIPTVKYPEINISQGIYSYGWISEGPYQLLDHEKDTRITHDFYFDNYTFGVVQWKIKDSEVILKHFDNEYIKDDLLNLSPYLRHSWMLVLYRLKYYLERNSLELEYLVENEKGKIVINSDIEISKD